MIWNSAPSSGRTLRAAPSPFLPMRNAGRERETTTLELGVVSARPVLRRASRPACPRAGRAAASRRNRVRAAPRRVDEQVVTRGHGSLGRDSALRDTSDHASTARAYAISTQAGVVRRGVRRPSASRCDESGRQSSRVRRPAGRPGRSIAAADARTCAFAISQHVGEGARAGRNARQSLPIDEPDQARPVVPVTRTEDVRWVEDDPRQPEARTACSPRCLVRS